MLRFRILSPQTNLTEWRYTQCNDEQQDEVYRPDKEGIKGADDVPLEAIQCGLGGLGIATRNRMISAALIPNTELWTSKPHF